MYLVVVVDPDNSIAGIPASWIKTIKQETYCYWPDKRPKAKVKELIKNKSDPSSSWQLLKCNIKVKTNNYEELIRIIKVYETEKSSSEKGSVREHSESPVLSSYSEFDSPAPPRKIPSEYHNCD